MVAFVPLDILMYKDVFVQLNIELITWIADQLREHYQIDAVAMIGQTISQYVEAHLEDLASLKPPNGVVYLLIIEEKIAGMGALRKLREGIGEIKRMYIRPPYRGRGYGKQMLNKLLEAGREIGCATFVLETSQFMAVAQHIYTSAGFVEREEYPASETPPTLRQYQRFMELKLTR